MKLYIIKPVCMMFLSESAFCSARLRLLCRRKESAGGLRPAKLSALAQGSSSDLSNHDFSSFDGVRTGERPRDN